MKPTILSLALAQSWLTPRAPDANKGSFGKVLVIGGDYGMPGAVRIAAEGAARIGAGLITVATRPEHIMTTASMRPEILCYGLHSALDVDILSDNATVIVLGPGLGKSSWSKELFDKVLQSTRPLLIDADGLNWLAQLTPCVRRDNWILTPHPGEAARLLGVTVQHVQADREQAVVQLQQRYGGVIVLKGAGTLIATDKLPVHQCVAGNPGMASAGMGDLLGGIIAGLVAQGLNLWQAALAGVMFHATAGDLAAQRLGMRGLLACDLLVELPAIINEL